VAKKRRDAKATKEKIIKNAMLLFSKNGYDATTTDEIAKVSDVNKAMIYYYFKNKSALYGAVMSYVLDAIYQEILSSDKCCPSPLGDLESFIKTYAYYCDKNPYFPALLLRELSDSGAHLPQEMFANMRQLFGLLSKILKEGEEQKIFHNVEPMIVHFMIVGSINLFITTKPLRTTTSQIEDKLNTCEGCSIEKIANYIFQKIKLMLEVNYEQNISCT